MFARTKRLTLRPGWPEDAAALQAAIAYEEVATKLSRVPWPYTIADADWFLALPRGAAEARFVICAHDDGPDGDATPRLIGTIGIHVEADGVHEFGYWLTPSAWGRGYATEAGRAVIDMARHALPIRRLAASYFVDNPASGNVLRKLGFRDLGRTKLTQTLARRDPVEAVMLECDLDDDGRPAMPIAA